MRCSDTFLASIATWLLLLRVIWAQSPSSAPTVIFKVYTAAGDGTTSYSGDGTSAINAGIKGPLGIVIDSSGNVYASDQNNRIRKITTTTGIISTYVGTGTAGYDNGAATSATVNSPYGLGIDSSDNIYIADAGNNRIRKVTTSTNIITTVAGTGSTGTTLQVAATDGSAATSALLYYPQGVALDTSGNVYIADTYDNRIRKVTVSTGIITTIAGTGATGYSGDGGAATSAAVTKPIGINVDSSGNVYFGDDGTYNVIRKIAVSTGTITTVAGTASTSGGYSGDNGAATSAMLNSPSDVVLDSLGNLYIADYKNNCIRKVTVATGIISTFAGTTRRDSDGDGGDATSAGITGPKFSRFDSSGSNYYISETDSNKVRLITGTVPIATLTTSLSTVTSTKPTTYPSLSPSAVDIITTIAGTGSAAYSGDNGQATAAALYSPRGVALDSSGNLYIADESNNRIRKVKASTGIITTIAGSGGTGSYSGDGGAATSAALYSPTGVALDASGNVYIGDSSNHRIRKVTVSTGIITTLAGSGGTGSYSGDNGQATAAALYDPTGIGLDASGNVYIADSSNHRVRKVTASTGIIITIAGTGTLASSGDGGAATSAELNYPRSVSLDASGNVYIADRYDNRVRKVTVSTGIITTIAGSGGTGSFSGDGGAATSATLYGPTGVALDASGNIYIADTVNQRVRKVTVSTGIITTIAGSGGTGSYSGDSGLATSAALDSPRGVSVDATGNVYIVDSDNNRIRKVTVGTTSTPSYSPTQPSYKPTAVPSTTKPSPRPTTMTPTCKPTTMTPSYTPTTSPSAYPTYTSSVRVYFMVTQVLSGITAATYSNNKVSNDALFKKTVVNMLGYDCRLEDVAIQQVSDYSLVSSRSLSLVAAAVDTELIYSVTTPTRIFNDTNTATALFIQALNESIATGVFDALLRTSGNADWLSASTAYTIFSTASPTSSPTSWPTSAPTKRDNVAINFLSAPLTADVAKAKINYYLGAFVGYFLSIYVCLYLCAFLRYGRATATKLYDTSYQSNAHVNNSADSTNELAILSDLRMKNEHLAMTRLLEEELVSVKAVARRSKRESTDSSDKNSLYSISVSEKLDNIFTVEAENKYSRGYREYMYQERTLLGCSPFLYPEGYAIPCVSTVFPPGRMEDILLFLCHNHPLFTCFYFMEGSKLGAHGTRILYIGKDMAVFVLYQFSNMLLQYFKLNQHGVSTFINLFIITPSAVSVGLLLKYLYTCPFTETVEFQRKYAKYQSTVIFLGRLAILPIMVIMFSSLIIACLFSSNRDVPFILINYFVFVQFYGILLAIVQAVLLFIDGYYYKLSLFGVLDVLCIGQLYKERILAEQLVVDVDYAYRIRTYLFGLIKVQKILNRDDAIKAKWIKIVSDDTVDIEMTGAADSDDGIVVRNPLSAKAASRRESASFTFDAIHSSNNDEEEFSGYSNIRDSADVVSSTENPIHASLRSDTMRLSRY